jgi:DNA-binding GntR family transcriptional regulator
MIPLNEKAYEHIKQLITTHQLSYDEIYSETKLAKELGISRTPFRDAIHRLAQEGYIDIIPSRGFRLHKLTKEDVENTFQVCSA